MTRRGELEGTPRVNLNLGYVYKPMSEVYHTNNLDFWTTSRANSLGFLDREPPRPLDAAESCHVVAIGDSYVEAKEVPIDGKFHLRLEAIAARELPEMEITTSAFGRGHTGQVNQLTYWDKYARFLRPKLLILVFVANDFRDNAPLLDAVLEGEDPEHRCQASFQRRRDGTMALRPPDPGCASYKLPRTAPSIFVRVLHRAERTSLFVRRLKGWGLPWPSHLPSSVYEDRATLLAQRPKYAALFSEWRPASLADLIDGFANPQLPPLLQDALDYTAFALQQFKHRADRDGTDMILLTTHFVGTHGDQAFERISSIAGKLEIPVVSQADYILRRGAKLEDAHWAHDAHWNANGHLWAAEALAEYLGTHPQVCRQAAPWR